jgi:hypothetical protein
MTALSVLRCAEESLEPQISHEIFFHCDQFLMDCREEESRKLFTKDSFINITDRRSENL